MVIGCLQGFAALPQDVHLKHRLRFGLHRKGADGMLIDALCHTVVQTINQLPDVCTELVKVFIPFRLEGDRCHQMLVVRRENGFENLFSHLDEKPARQLNSCDVSETGTLADGHSVGGPGGGEVQPVVRHNMNYCIQMC